MAKNSTFRVNWRKIYRVGDTDVLMYHRMYERTMLQVCTKKHGLQLRKSLIFTLHLMEQNGLVKRKYSHALITPTS